MGLRKLGRNTSPRLRKFIIFTTGAITLILFYHLTQRCPTDSEAGPDKKSYDRKTTPLIFIGGWPRSGTTLMRAMLDAHPDVRCGEETHLIPMVLGKLVTFRKNPTGQQRLLEAGISDDVLYSALGKFILEIVVGHAEPAARLCNKDPFTLEHMPELADVFPLGRFLLMIRDGRAVCHSVASRNVRIRSINTKNLTMCLEKWNRSVMRMFNDCLELGDAKCLPVQYEQLVLHPRSILTKVLEFVGVSWDEVVLHHETKINEPGGISLSRLEPSTDQVVKPVNLDSLTTWANFIPDEVRQQMKKLAPMLERLGYDPDAYPPNYGKPDKEVEENTLLVQKNQVLFKELAWKARNRTKVLDQ